MYFGPKSPEKIAKEKKWFIFEKKTLYTCTKMYKNVEKIIFGENEPFFVVFQAYKFWVQMGRKAGAEVSSRKIKHKKYFSECQREMFW